MAYYYLDRKEAKLIAVRDDGKVEVLERVLDHKKDVQKAVYDNFERESKARPEGWGETAEKMPMKRIGKVKIQMIKKLLGEGKNRFEIAHSLDMDERQEFVDKAITSINLKTK